MRKLPVQYAIIFSIQSIHVKHFCLLCTVGKKSIEYWHRPLLNAQAMKGGNNPASKPTGYFIDPGIGSMAIRLVSWTMIFYRR
jgi:hypothetical protein